jgi:hypothetical protein
MSDIKARYVGSSEGVSLSVPVDEEGEPNRQITVPHGGELPMEIDGFNVPASFRDSLLEQKDNWTQVKRKSEAKSSAKADEKED